MSERWKKVIVYEVIARKRRLGQGNSLLIEQEDLDEELDFIADKLEELLSFSNSEEEME